MTELVPDVALGSSHESFLRAEDLLEVVGHDLFPGIQAGPPIRGSTRSEANEYSSMISPTTPIVSAPTVAVIAEPYAMVCPYPAVPAEMVVVAAFMPASFNGAGHR